MPETNLVHLPGRLEFSEEQRRMIRATFCGGEHPATDEEFSVLMEIARARGLNPLLRQVHFVSRWDSQRRGYVWSTQISIDGLRAVAERTGQYAGQDEPEFEEKDGNPILCRVRVYKKGTDRPFVGTARWAEYAQHKKDGGLTSFWATKPYLMLAKCAEALALRKAFPEDMGGLYVPEEEAPPETDVTPTRPEGQPRTEAIKASLPPAPPRMERLLKITAMLREMGRDPVAFAREVLKHDRRSNTWTDDEVLAVETAAEAMKVHADEDLKRIEAEMIEGGGGGELA